MCYSGCRHGENDAETREKKEQRTRRGSAETVIARGMPDIKSNPLSLQQEDATRGTTDMLSLWNKFQIEYETRWAGYICWVCPDFKTREYTIVMQLPRFLHLLCAQPHPAWVHIINDDRSNESVRVCVASHFPHILRLDAAMVRHARGTSSRLEIAYETRWAG